MQTPGLDDLIKDIRNLTGEDEIYLISAKLGIGVEELLKAIIEKIPPPNINSDNSAAALVFDSHFDPYKGIVAHVRVFAGNYQKFQEVYLRQANYKFKIVELGIFKPELF